MSPEKEAQIQKILNEITAFELSGTIRYTHYALMVTGPYRLPLVDFFKNQALESLQHAQRAGEIMTGLGGHPQMDITPIPESHQHSVRSILQESYSHEKLAIELYRKLVDLTSGDSVFLEEYARSMVATEEDDLMQLRMMLRDLDSDH